MASTPDRDLEPSGLAEGKRRRHIVRIDAPDDHRRPPVDQQVEAETVPRECCGEVGGDVHLARPFGQRQRQWIGSPPFSPVSLRRAALLPIMCFPPMTAIV